MWVGFAKEMFSSDLDFQVEAVAVVGLSCSLLQLGGELKLEMNIDWSSNPWPITF